jgi:hypothetical protein
LDKGQVAVRAKQITEDPVYLAARQKMLANIDNQICQTNVNDPEECRTAVIIRQQAEQFHREFEKLIEDGVYQAYVNKQ